MYKAVQNVIALQQQLWSQKYICFLVQTLDIIITFFPMYPLIVCPIHLFKGNWYTLWLLFYASKNFKSEKSVVGGLMDQTITQPK